MIVYKITNKINSKCYVGITTREFEIRKAEHLYQVNKSNYPLYRAIRKYGLENFIFSIIDSAKTVEELKEKEIYHIDKNNSFNTGYNQTKGGSLFKGEDNFSVKLSQKEVDKIINLLDNTKMTYKEIVEKLQLDVSHNHISAINLGKLWRDQNKTYPIRENSYANNIGAKNASSKLAEEDVLNIIKMLESTRISQAKIAEQYDVGQMMISRINTCKNWTHLHNYKSNIRKGV